MKRDISKLFVSSLAALSLLTVSADEGMWMLHNLPDAVFERMQNYGWQLPRTSLYGDTASLSRCVVNFSGYCTGEVVSPRGLLMTNHHCGFEAIRSHSTTEHDYLLNGFVSDSIADELPCDGLFAAFMLRQEEVTGRLQALGIDTLTAFDRGALIDSLEEAMTRDVETDDSSLYVEIDPFYEGNAYYATTYRRYSDIRLVFAPPKSLGKFGGERDNWMWPRQTCDFSVFRIYVDPVTGGPAEYSKKNVPMGTAKGTTAATPYLHVSTDGYQDGNFAMILGYPGSTERYLSSYGIEQMRDCVNDPMQQVRGVKQAIMKRHMNASEEVRIKYDSKYAQSSNYWKNAIGMNKCIDSVGIVQMKREFEQRLADWTDTVDLARLAAYYDHQRTAMRAYTLFTETFTRRSNNELATRAYRYCNGMPVVGPAGKPRRQYMRFADNSDSYDRDLDVEVMAALLANYREQITKMYGQDTVKYLPSIYSTIDMKFNGDYRRYVEHLWDNSVLMTSKKIPMRLSKKLQRDPGIEFSMSLVETLADIRMVLDSLKDSIQTQERLLCAAKIRMEQDLPHYSDANFTMRLTYGQVGGYRLGSYSSGTVTSMQSLLDKVSLYDGWHSDTTSVHAAPNPYDEYFLESDIKQLFSQEVAGVPDSLATTAAGGLFPLCFLTNNDITGGNSGSPVIDGNGRLIGLAFDGTWDSLSSDIYFDSTLARTISVDIRYVLYVISRWGHADRLIKEMLQ